MLTLRNYFSSISKIELGFTLLFFVATIFAIVTYNFYYLIIPFVLLSGYIAIVDFQLFFYLLLTSIPFSTECELGTSGFSTDFPDEILMWMSTLSIGLCVVQNPIKFIRTTPLHPLFILISAMLIWIFISCIFSSQVIVSFKYFLAKIWYVVPFVFIPQWLTINKRGLLIMGYCLIISMFIIICIILINHAYTHFEFEEINNAVRPFFRNHVNYGALLVFMFPILIVLAKNNPNKKISLKWKVIISIFLMALVFTYSRGAWLAFIIGIIAYYLILQKKLLLTIGICFGALILFFIYMFYNNHYLKYAPDYNKTIFHTNFNDHLQATYELKDISTMERFNRWVAGINMIKEKPIIGYGPNTFSSIYKSYTVSSFRTWVSINTEKSTIHNYFLLQFVEQGIIGLLLFITLTFTAFYYVEKIVHHTANNTIKYTTLCIGVILSMIVVINLLSDMIEADKVGPIYFLCIGLLIRLDIYSTKKSM